MNSKIKLTALGQVGYILDIQGTRIVIDPYLSDYVETLYGAEFKRISPKALNASDINDVEYILISHEHEDHCDPITLQEIYDANNKVKVICPKECNAIIQNIPFIEVINPKVLEEIKIEKVNLKIIPSCHPELSIKDDFSRFLGFIIEIDGFIMYHPGDTIPFKEAKEYLPKKINLAFLPINERNYFRDSVGIIGNMTIREAIQWTQELNVEHWIPTHWDVFRGNSTFKEELDLLSMKMDMNNYSWIDAGTTYEINY